MLCSANQLITTTLTTDHGVPFPVRDLIFNDHDWRVEAVAVEGSNGFSPDRLISWKLVQFADRQSADLTTALSASVVESAPTIDTIPPVVQVLDRRCAERYGLLYDLLGRTFTPGLSRDPEIVDDLESSPPDGRAGNFRSVREVIGYDLVASDGQIGHIEDLALDPANGAITAVIIDTRNFWPGGEKVSLHVDDLDTLDVVGRSCTTALSVELVRAAPLVELAEKKWNMRKLV